MNPAYSIIFFTTASGAGYGMLIVLGSFAAMGTLPQDRWLGLASLGLALVLVTAGLVSSTYHLGHPERAWRAFSQWRSSWLSREGVLAVATYVPVILFAITWVGFADTNGVSRWIALLAALGAFATVLSTGMIYASLAAVPAWHNPWVPPVYLFLGVMTGALWLSFLAVVNGTPIPALKVAVIAAIVLAGGFKLSYWASIKRDRGASTVESATGLGELGGQPTVVRLLDPPHTEKNYLQREMGYVIARKHADRLRQHASLLTFALPLMLSLLALGFDGWAAGFATFAAALLGSVGVVIERWLFFAEAEHKAMLYYGAQAI